MTYVVEKLSCIATVPCSLFLYTLENTLDIYIPAIQLLIATLL